MNDRERLIANLKGFMEASGLDNQTKLGRAAGLSQTNMSNIMRGTVSPTMETLTQMAAALGVEVGS